ncbi:hypothetical protein M9H77_16463 [Catharanthus roseus]|uniref:Uncharacterized protein n=1 Tax=Catharanthus roseus TaxID=4058 RepID=A0ACC0B1U0_CATRO|nr:hypothetical protein M9H77_16463 [Catharanthus roseus]
MVTNFYIKIVRSEIESSDHSKGSRRSTHRSIQNHLKDIQKKHSEGDKRRKLQTSEISLTKVLFKSSSLSQMKVISAYLLLVLGGNSKPTASDIKHVLGSVGADADDDRIDLLLSQLEGKDIAEVIAAGREKLASVPAGGGAVAVAPAAASGGGAAAPAAETKKEEKVEEKEESDDVSDLIGMLDLMIF